MGYSVRSGLLVAAWATVIGSFGCCLQTRIVPIVDSGETVDGGRDGGLDAGDGGRDAGDAGELLDAGTCRIGDAGPIPAGTWLDAFYGSCTICDPSLDPNGWTVFDAGEVCESFSSVQPHGSLAVPTSGRCAPMPTFPFASCNWGTAGSTCNDSDGFGCGGGFCNDAGWCEVDQNLGYIDSCGDSNPPNPCAEGPCCLDAGFEGIPGGGWCCGLIDGGVQTCLPYRGVCFTTSDCCSGLTCVGHTAVYDSDAGYGFCE